MSKDKDATKPEREARLAVLSADEVIRLECVRIAFRHDHEAARVVRTASSLEAYVATGKVPKIGDDDA